MFIADVDQGLEKFLRARLPLPEHVGDVSFDPPNENWSASLSRLTINLFLYQVQRSTQPGRAAINRTTEDGQLQQRRALPMIELGYMVSAWAGSPRDEHQLLGDAISLLAGEQYLPTDFTPPGLSTSVQLALGDEIKPREVWQGVGGKLKASFVLRATVAANTWDWRDAAEAVEGISILSAPNEHGERSPLAPNWPTAAR